MPARAGAIVRDQTGHSMHASATGCPPEFADAADRPATSVPVVDACAPGASSGRREASRSFASRAADLLPLLACVAVWLAGHAHHLPAAQRHLVHRSVDFVRSDRLEVSRLGKMVPARPARAVAPASGAVLHGLSRFVHEWTLGRAGEMSRREKVEIASMRTELDAVRMRAHGLIAALHEREVAQQQALINRRAWSQWRARRLARALDEAPPERILLVLAAAAAPACVAGCPTEADRPSRMLMASAD